MLRDQDLLFAKLALGRELLAREDALRIARDLTQARRSGRVESFGAAAVRLGYLEPRHARQLEDDLQRGRLVCRGACGRARPAVGAGPRDAERCSACGGPIYLGRPEVEAGGGKTGLTVLELDVPLLPSDAADRPPSESFSATAVTAPVAAIPARAGGPVLNARAEGPALNARAEGPALNARAGPTFTASGTAIVRPLPPRGTEPMLATPLPIPGSSAAEKTQAMENAPASLPPGFEPFLLPGGVRVVAPLGRGGTGSVYRGLGPDGQVVAVKILRVVADPEALQRFDREVRISTLLDHPQIVKVLETGTVPEGHLDAGKPYCVMEYVAGRDLTAWIAERPRRPAECAALIARLCDAVEHANQKAVIHRDIKPANVLVRSSDELPVLCDFGLARYRARGVTMLTDQGDILGTPAFMAPEQARGQPSLVGPPTDVYGLGAVLYRLVAGRPPFQGPTPFATIEAVVRHAPTPPRQLNPEVTPALEQVMLKALAKDPRERYHTVSRLKAALLQAIGA